MEKTLNHDVIAFTTAVAEKIDHPASRWLHFGLTSSDIVDTALAVQMVQSAGILVADAKELRNVIARRAREHMLTPCIAAAEASDIAMRAASVLLVVAIAGGRARADEPHHHHHHHHHDAAVPATGTLVAPDSTVGKVFFLTGEGPSSVLQAFDQHTFLPLGWLAVPGVRGHAGSLIRWGIDGLAFRTDQDQLFLIRTDLVTASELAMDSPSYVVSLRLRMP